MRNAVIFFITNLRGPQLAMSVPLEISARVRSIGTSDLQRLIAGKFCHDVNFARGRRQKRIPYGCSPTAYGMRGATLLRVMREAPGVLAIIALCFLSGVEVSVRAQTSARNHFFEIPFELVHDQVLLEVKIGGKGPFTMLLDTDTDPSAIDLETARYAELNDWSKAYKTRGVGKE